MTKLILTLLIPLLIFAGCTSRNHSNLVGKPAGLNVHYVPHGEPSKKQRELGALALIRWPKADQNERYWLADDIVASKVLIGFAQKDVEKYLGSVTPIYECKTETDFPRNGLSGCISKYNILPMFPTHESTCELCAEYGDDERVKIAYVDVNN